MFKINGINASEDDFGYTADLDCENAPEYGCGNKQFVRNDSCDDEVLKKYGITEAEYYQICDILESELDVGPCGWCI